MEFDALGQGYGSRPLRPGQGPRRLFGLKGLLPSIIGQVFYDKMGLQQLLEPGNVPDILVASD